MDKCLKYFKRWIKKQANEVGWANRYDTTLKEKKKYTSEIFG